MTNVPRTATALAALLALLYAFPANAAAPGQSTRELAFLGDMILLLTIAGVLVFIARNRDKGSTYVNGNPADRKIVRTCVTIAWSHVAVAWAAVVAAAVHWPALIQPVLANIVWMPLMVTLVALLWRVPNSRVRRHPRLMILAVLALALALALSLATSLLMVSNA